MRKTVPVKEVANYIGKDMGYSDWLRIDQSRIDRFAAVTDDRQFIHIDPVRAEKTIFGGTIAHGYLTLSMLTHLTSDIVIVPEGTSMMLNYGFDKVRFLQPVKAGDEIRARAQLLEVTHKQPGRLLLKAEVTVEVRGNPRPAMFAECLTLVVMD